MTPEEFKTLCEQHGGQAQLARELKLSSKQINNLCQGRSKISEQLAAHIELLYGVTK